MKKINGRIKTEQVPTTNDNNEVPLSDIGIIIDDNMRKNATTVRGVFFTMTYFHESVAK